MQNTIAHIVSVGLHPLLLPSYAILYFFMAPTFLSMVDTAFVKTILMIVFVLTAIAPALITLLMYNMGVVKTLTLKNRSDRFFPMAAAIILYVFCFIVLKKLPAGIPNIITYFFLTSAISIFLTLTVNFFTKISAHLAGIGGMAGYLVVFHIYMGLDSFLPIIVITSAVSLLAFARLKLGEHNSLQVISGLSLGFFTALSSLILL